MRRNLKAPGVLLSDWFYLGLLSVFLTLFHWKVILQGQVYVALDSSRFFFPVWKWGWGVFQEGHIPLWNPDAQFGVPHLADPQTACAYLPLWLLYLLLGPVTGFSMAIVLHHFWALLGFWSFSKGQGLSSKAAFLGSVTFGFSLHLVGSSWTPPALMAISWLPWVFWAAEKVFRKEKGSFLWLSLTWAMQLACGYPVLAYLTGLGMGAHYLWKSVPIREFSWVVRFLAAAMVAACYNLAWGLPFAEMLPLTNYAEGAKRFHELGWKDLATFLSPFPQGHPLEPNDQTTPYWVGSFYLGLPVLGLLVWGAWRKAFRQTSLWLLLLLLVLSLGWLGTVFRSVLPGYSLVVHSGFWISILTLYGIWMAMEAMDKLQEHRKVGAWVGGGLVIVTLLTLVPSARGLLATKDRPFYGETPKALLSLPPENRLFFTPPEIAGAVRLQGKSLDEAYEDAKQRCIPNWPLAFGCEVAPFYNTLQLKHAQAWTFDAFRQSDVHSRKALNYLGIRFIFGKTRFKDLRPVQDDWFNRAHYSEKNGDMKFLEGVEENRDFFPKWYSVTKARPAGVSLEADFAEAAKEGMDYRKECFVRDASKAGNYDEVGRVRAVLDPAFSVVMNKMVEVSPSKNQVSVKVRERALMVSSETAYPGWKVTHGIGRFEQEAPLEVVNHAFRGLVLEKGDWFLRFKFEPISFRLGLFISLLVCAFWGALVLRRLRA